MEEEEVDPFRPTGSETMEEPNNLETGERRIRDVIDSIGDGLPDTNDQRIATSPENIIGTGGPNSSVSLGYDSVDSGTPKSSVLPDSDAYLTSPKKPLKLPQVDVTDAAPVNQDNDMSSR